MLKLKKPAVSPAKKPIRKKAIPKKRTAKKEIVPEIEPTQKEFVNIIDHDPDLKMKSRLSWLIIGVLLVILIPIWFWTMKKNITNYQNDDELKKLSEEIGKSVDDFKGIIKDTKEIVGTANTAWEQQQEIENIKQAVLRQIQVNLESEKWPQHSSDLMKLSLKYPETWSKQETKNSIVLTNYDLQAETAPELFAKIEINKTDQAIDLQKYSKSNEEIFIDLIPAVKYNTVDAGTDDLSYILTIKDKKNSYQINVYAKNGRNLFEPIIDKILSTINLL